MHFRELFRWRLNHFYLVTWLFSYKLFCWLFRYISRFKSCSGPKLCQQIKISKRDYYLQKILYLSCIFHAWNESNTKKWLCIKLLTTTLTNNAMEHCESNYEQKIIFADAFFYTFTWTIFAPSPNSANDINNDRKEMWNNNNSLGKVKIDVSMTSGNDKNEKNH